MQQRQWFQWKDGVAHFTFGVHKGQALEEVAAREPGYLVCTCWTHVVL